MMDKQRKLRLINKAKSILNPESTTDLNVKPWDPNKIKRARNWFGNDGKVQGIIANHYQIKK